MWYTLRDLCAHAPQLIYKLAATRRLSALLYNEPGKLGLAVATSLHDMAQRRKPNCYKIELLRVGSSVATECVLDVILHLPARHQQAAQASLHWSKFTDRHIYSAPSLCDDAAERHV
jgi:hypothetical protein